jgi:CheY-like chemotaxis protein
VTVALHAREGHLVLEVRDTGIGIPPDQTQVIFEEFRQLDNPNRNRGSGLGLAIVAKMAGLLGVEVRVRSTPGRGSLFAIELPAGRMLERSPTPPLLDQPRQCLRVALVDDNIQILRALGLLMRGEGHIVVSGVNGNELMDGLGDQAPDLVISDFRLGAGETGFDVIERVRERFRIDVPAVIITGDTDPVMIRSMAAHDIEVQFKPLKPADLLALVGRVPARSLP